MTDKYDVAVIGGGILVSLPDFICKNWENAALFLSMAGR